MTTTSFAVRSRRLATLLLITAGLGLLASCKKETPHPRVQIDRSTNPAAAFSSDVLDKWITMELRLMRNASGIPNQAFSRHFAYAGVTALEALAPGLPGGTSALRNRFNGLTRLPEAGKAKEYFFPANVNAALAAINRALFPSAAAADKQAIDSLENALKTEFAGSESPTVLSSSESFGQKVAAAVFNWAETDGYKDASKPYTVPVGPGLWAPTPPGYAATPVSPFWGNNRPILVGSIANTDLPAPPAYSAHPGSPFYEMVKEVYDVSLKLSDEQKAMAMFWRDVPGVTSPGHWLSILQQAVRSTGASLDRAAYAFSLTGIAINDALIACWKVKYQYDLVRPVTYIREFMGQGSWTSYLGTPAHPEYPSAHAVLSVAAGEVMDRLFGRVNLFTDHTYDYLGFPARSYRSFLEIGKEAAQSRLYAGIHYQLSIDAGIDQGRTVAENIVGKREKEKPESGTDVN